MDVVTPTKEVVRELASADTDKKKLKVKDLYRTSFNADKEKFKEWKVEEDVGDVPL